MWRFVNQAWRSAAFTYDEIGNTLTDGTWTYTWERGRQLKSMTNDTTTWNMTYDADGLRTSRTDGTNTYYYYYHEGLLTYMKYNSLVMRFSYDAQGKPVSMTYNGNLYFYALNQQGDVMALLDVDGNEVVSYHYNAWGEILSTTASTETMRLTLAKYNPLRYRGYIYDRETGLYYISSRYYNPEICRWINADSVLPSTGSSPIGYNMFAYCFNNPVNMTDPSGNWPSWATKLVAAVAVVAVVAVAATVCVATCGASSMVAAVAVGAAKGAAVGLATGAASGAAIGYTTTGTLEGTLEGMANGALSGVISGAISGGTSAGSKFGTFSSKTSLNQHFIKHGDEFGGMYANAKEYAQGAKYVIKNGTYIPEKNAYIKFLGSQGKANYAFVGMKTGGRVSTYHVRSVSKMIKDGISLFS